MHPQARTTGGRLHEDNKDLLKGIHALVHNWPLLQPVVSLRPVAVVRACIRGMLCL